VRKGGGGGGGLVGMKGYYPMKLPPQHFVLLLRKPWPQVLSFCMESEDALEFKSLCRIFCLAHVALEGSEGANLARCSDNPRAHQIHAGRLRQLNRASRMRC